MQDYGIFDMIDEACAIAKAEEIKTAAIAAQAQQSMWNCVNQYQQDLLRDEIERRQIWPWL